MKRGNGPMDDSLALDELNCVVHSDIPSRQNNAEDAGRRMSPYSSDCEHLELVLTHLNVHAPRLCLHENTINTSPLGTERTSKLRNLRRAIAGVEDFDDGTDRQGLAHVLSRHCPIFPILNSPGSRAQILEQLRILVLSIVFASPSQDASQQMPRFDIQIPADQIGRE